ncbi:MAG: hypothetical protein ACN4GB_05985, partial [Candidatus Nanopelagicales bacterium]
MAKKESAGKYQHKDRIDSSNPEQWLEYGTNILGLMVAPTMPDDGTVYLKMDERPFRFAIQKADT